MSDLISRQAAIEAVRKIGGALASITTDGHETILIDKAAVQTELMFLPTAEPKKGKWIRHGLKSVNIPWGYDCSACGAWFVVGDDTVEKFACCPKCGARMERSEE